MTSADPEEVVTTTSDGITVEKSFEPDDFPVPAIAFVVSSDRAETVSIRLVDSVPDDVAPENIGFHPKYGAEFWDVEGDSIVFEREIEPDEEYTTVYGLRGSGADTAAKFMSDPQLASVEPPLESEPEDTPTSEDDLTEDSVEADEESVEAAPGDSPDLDSEEPTEIGVDEPAEPDDDHAAEAVALELESDMPGDEQTVEEIVDTETAEDDDTGAISPATDDLLDDTRASSEGSRLLEELAEEINAADPDDRELQTLRDALSLDPVRASVETRIEHLQSSVADLDAYSDALEAFLDENGDAQQLIEDVQAEYEETTDRLDTLESLVDDNAESAAEIEERFEAKIDEVDSQINALEADIEALSTDLSEVTEMRTRLANALGGLGESPSADTDDE